jgi:outer membrane lipoprotein-sorting protein
LEQIEDEATHGRRRWFRPALIIVPAAAVATAAALYFVFGALDGGNANPTATEVLAGALETIEDPGSVGLESYRGVLHAEMSVANLGTFEDEDSFVKLWFRHPREFRAEVGDLSNPASGDQALLAVGDGESYWRYDPISNQYAHSGPEETGIGAFEYAFLIMPGAFAGNGGLDALLKPGGLGSGFQAELAGEELVLGREAYVIEITPAYSGGCSGDGCNGTPEHYEGGVVRMWLDKEYLVTLRMEMPLGPDGSAMRVRFTEVAFNEALDDTLFQFTPPPGAVEVADAEDVGHEGAEEDEPYTETAVAEPLTTPAP